MKKAKTNKKIFISIIIVAVLLVIGVVVFLLIAKPNNKDEFIKYAEQLFNNKNGFWDDKLDVLEEKKESYAYENKGSIKFNISDENGNENVLKELNNDFYISFAGNTDNEKNMAEQLIKINYNKDTNFPIVYKKIDDMQAVKFSKVNAKYFATQRENGVMSFFSNNQQATSNDDTSVQKTDKNEMILSNSKNSIYLKVTEILSEKYPSIYVNHNGDGQDIKGDIVNDLNIDYDIDDVDVEVAEAVTEGNIAIITVQIKDNASYYIEGTVDKSGIINWGEIQKPKEKEKKQDDNNETSDSTKKNGNFKDDCIKILKLYLNDKDISKVSSQNENEERFVWNLKNTDLKEMIAQLLNRIKDNEKMLDRLHLNKEQIDSLKSFINSIIKPDGKSSITVNGKNKKLEKITLEINGILKIELTKDKTDEGIEYLIEVTSAINDNNIVANLKEDISGLEELKTITKNYTLELSINDIVYTINAENKINFRDDITIDQLNENEYANLDRYSEEGQQKIIKLLTTKIINSNIEMLSQVGINNILELISIIPNGVNINIEQLRNLSMSNENNNTNGNGTTPNENPTNPENQVNPTTPTEGTTPEENATTPDGSQVPEGQTPSDSAESFAETEKKVFNSKFQAYEGNKVRGASVKQLIMYVIASNMADEERQIAVSGVVTLTGNEVPDGIEATQLYKVKLVYSELGYVNEVKIEKNDTDSSEVVTQQTDTTSESSETNE